MAIHLDESAVQVSGHYGFRSVRTDAAITFYRPKVYQEIWPGACRVTLDGVDRDFLALLSPAHLKHLSEPGIKRLFFLSQVEIPWPLSKSVDLLFAYQLEASGKVYFVLDSTDEIAAVLKRSANRANARNLRLSRIFLILLFPLSLLLYKPLFGSRYVVPKPLPEMLEFQRFVGKNYQKGNPT